MPMHIHPVGLSAMWMPWKSTLSRVCQCPRISTQSESVLGLVPGFANAHGNPQIFAVPWMPWKSTLSQSTLIGPGFANGPCISTQSDSVPCGCHGNPHYPALAQCPRISTQSESVLGLVPGFASAHGNPQIFAVPWMPWKSTLSQSTLIGPGFANAHAYPPSRIQCHVDAMEIHTIPVHPPSLRHES